MKLGWSVLLIALLLTAASAADINGKWKAEYQSPDGQTRTTTFTFKVDGEKLTGTVAGSTGEVPIQEGKVKEDAISFFAVRNFGGNDVKISYKGKAAGDEIKFNVTFGGMDRTFDMTAKRLK